MIPKTQKLANSALLTALSIVLSFVILYEMPMGGSVTLACMLPVMFVSLRYGCKWGLGSAFVTAVFQLMQAVMHANVFPYCETTETLIICILFDYVCPFTLVGLAGLFRKLTVGSFRHFGAYLGMVLVFVARFLCHFVTGVAIWGQWAPEGMGKFLYSFLYNGGFLLPELIITMVLAAILLESPQIKKYIDLDVDKASFLDGENHS
jgi:thiamine transporter